MIDPTLINGAKQGLENMLFLKKGDKACIVTDQATMIKTENAFVEVANQITGEKNVTVYVLEDSGERPLKKVPEGLEVAAKEADVTMFVAQALGEELETVRKPLIKTATKYGASHGHCPGFTSQMMSQGMATDYKVVYALSSALKDILSGKHRFNITSEAGTNLIVDTLKHFPWLPSQPIARGDYANLPDGEVFCFPADVNGTAVFDGCVGDNLAAKYRSISGNPLYVQIQNGMAVDIACPGNQGLKKDFRTYVLNLDGKREFLTRRVGEFALGTNLGVNIITGNLLQDEKCGRAVHLAFGDPLDHSGTKAGYECKGHMDALIVDPTVRADGILIMENGLYTEKVMKAALQHLPIGYHLATGRDSHSGFSLRKLVSN